MNLKKRLAFTLMEIMVASAIMSAVVLAVLSATSGVLSIWQKSTGQLQSFFDSGIVGNIMQEDLESTFFKRDGNTWFTVFYPEEPIGALAGKYYLDTIPLRPPEITFYSRTTMRPMISYMGGVEQKIPGNLCAIKYQVMVKSPFKEGGASPEENAKQPGAFYGLYRAVIDSKSTMTDFIPMATKFSPSSDLNYQLIDFWNNGKCQILDEMGNYKRNVALKNWALGSQNLLVTNIVDFKVTFSIIYPNPDLDPEQSSNVTRDSTSVPRYKRAYIPPGVSFSIGKTLTFLEASDENLIYEFNHKGKVPIFLSEKSKSRAVLAGAEISMVFVSDRGAKEMRSAMANESMTEDLFKQMLGKYASDSLEKRIDFIGEPLD